MWADVRLMLMGQGQGGIFLLALQQWVQLGLSPHYLYTDPPNANGSPTLVQQ